MSFLFIVFLLVILLYLLILFFLIRNLIYFLPILWGAPFVATSEQKAELMLKLLQLKPGETLYDLGSGDGRIIIKAVEKYGVKAVGIEINPLFVYLSRERIKKLGLQEKAKVLWGNFFKKNLSDANAIAIYLLQSTNYRLEKKLLSELKPGTRIISLLFVFKNIPFVRSAPTDSRIRLYQIP